MRKFYYALIIASLIIVTDQITKYLVNSSISPLDSVKIFPFLHLVHVRNKGAAFGMFSGIGSDFFIVVSVIAIIIVLLLLLKSKESYVGLSLILGGAIGNLIDRVSFGYVLDFMDFSIDKYHWPAFNVADSALTVGITIVFLIPLLRKVRRD